MLNDLGVVTVTIHTFVRGVFVDNHEFVTHRLGFDMALGTRNVGMAAGQRQMGAGVVVKG